MIWLDECPECGAEWPHFGSFEGSSYYACERCGWTDAPEIPLADDPLNEPPFRT